MNYAKFSIDTNVFIYAFEFPESNSAKILDLLNNGEIEAIISDLVVKEVTKYFEKFHNLQLARKFRRYLLESCIVITRSNVLEKIDELKGQIKDKDLEQLAVTKRYALKYLIAYDRDFDGFEEYITPKEFIEMLKKEINESEF